MPVLVERLLSMTVQRETEDGEMVSYLHHRFSLAANQLRGCWKRRILYANWQNIDCFFFCAHLRYEGVCHDAKIRIYTSTTVIGNFTWDEPEHACNSTPKSAYMFQPFHPSWSLPVRLLMTSRSSIKIGYGQQYQGRLSLSRHFSALLTPITRTHSRLHRSRRAVGLACHYRRCYQHCSSVSQPSHSRTITNGKPRLSFSSPGPISEAVWAKA